MAGGGTTAEWDKIHSAVVKAAGVGRLRVGVLASKGGNESRGGITMVELAAIHEFGSPDNNIPARSFIRATFLVRRVNALATMQTKLAEKIVLGGMPARRALGILGAWAASEVKKTFTEIDIPPPLRQATIDAKGSSKPLIDTGRLLGAVTWEVVE